MPGVVSILTHPSLWGFSLVAQHCTAGQAEAAAMLASLPPRKQDLVWWHGLTLTEALEDLSEAPSTVPWE